MNTSPSPDSTELKATLNLLRKAAMAHGGAFDQADPLLQMFEKLSSLPDQDKPDRQNPLLVWSHHGLIACSRDPETRPQIYPGTLQQSRSQPELPTRLGHLTSSELCAVL